VGRTASELFFKIGSYGDSARIAKDCLDRLKDPKRRDAKYLAELSHESVQLEILLKNSNERLNSKT